MARITTVEQLRAILQEPRETTKLKVMPALDDQAKDFISTSPFALLATADEAGTVEVSPKGDEPGFTLIEDDRTLLVPERTGNRLAYGLTNIIATGRVGMIYLRPRTGETLRLSGRAEIFNDADLLNKLGSDNRPALLAIRVHIEKCFFHCARAFLRAKLWEPESWPAAQRISFGKIIAPKIGEGEAVAKQIDDTVAEAYTTRLWSNG
ncbi:MSMEG_1061 family FMN-dependent PPOX-type flavoprotein [Afipia sp. P52-10]|jgi:PPOX class probable FMN-dependent enzyme|uniref:MSMEG_1061 family FMN-dependent PPOX-type flavoprotein n=1 Tax=Afipia sp. P52-10 TaxID=1429916 RepID=UPI0004BC637B|nr:MSMEG_1061 family FMN-dependent PPOX-type flavoprotein [Afipia sp. P52-10]